MNELQEERELRLAELIASLSLATDLGMGQPLEFALCGCVLSVRLGEALGLDESDLRDLYYLALLRHLGCNVDAHLVASFVEDELLMRANLAPVDYLRPADLMRALFGHFRQVHPEATPLHLARVMARGVWGMSHVFKEGGIASCEVAQRLAKRLGFGEKIQQALTHAYERWDGRGVPFGVKGENVALAVRVVTVAQDAVLFQRMAGTEAAIAVIKERTGRAYDPRVVEQFCQHASHLLVGLNEEPSWETVLALEPGVPVLLSASHFDAACRAIADFTDLKTPFTLGHSSGVAALAAEAAAVYGLPEADAVTICRAGLLHDVGRTGVSGGIWAKPGPLSEREWERVRLHSYYTERVLARPAALARLGSVAALHHERLDGSGYHRGLSANQLVPAARILAAADVYHAMIEPRPHRPARTPEAAAEELRREVRAGRIDADAANAVLVAAGHHVRAARREAVGGLSEREIEVLRLVARGHSMKQMATELTLSPKTVDRHIQNIYTKIGVSTRAAAALFAMQHHLLTDLQ